jgi:hypothetical protein
VQMLRALLDGHPVAHTSRLHACTSQPLAPQSVPKSRRAHEIRCGSVGLYRHIGEAARRRRPLKRTNPPPRHRAAAPATMSLAAMFVFLLVSALQTIDSVLDLARKVCAEKTLSSFVQENILLERKDSNLIQSRVL